MSHGKRAVDASQTISHFCKMLLASARFAQPDAKHIEITHSTEQLCKPTQFGFEFRSPLRIHKISKNMQDRAKPPRSYAHLVNRLRLKTHGSSMVFIQRSKRFTTAALHQFRCRP